MEITNVRKNGNVNETTEEAEIRLGLEGKFYKRVWKERRIQVMDTIEDIIEN